MKKLFCAVFAVLIALPALAQFDLYGTCTVAQLAPVQTFTANITNAGIDVHGYIGTPVVVMSYTNVAGTNSTLQAKLEESADDTTYTAISASSFELVTNTGAFYGGVVTVGVTPGSTMKYVRVVQNISGTSSPQFRSSVVLIGRKKYN